MLEKNNKISVLNKMIGNEMNTDPPPYVVPQNSENNLRPHMCINDMQSTEKLSRCFPMTTTKCEHCENMAKNFLYLESLIRTNYDSSHNCKLCYSSLQYLQYVNKNIMEVFGNFDSIVEAAKAFRIFQNPLAKITKKPTSSSGSSDSTTSGKSKTRKMLKAKSRNTQHHVTLDSKRANGKAVNLRSKSKLKTYAGRSSAIKSPRTSSKKLKTIKFSKKPLLHKIKPKTKSS